MAVDPLSTPPADAPSAIRVPGSGSNVLSYQVAAGASLRIEAIAVDADASAAGNSTITCSYLDPSGLTVAESSTRNAIPSGTLCEVTFAPFLPDTADVGAAANEAQLQTGLVATTLSGHSTVRLETLDAPGILTEARICAAGAVGPGPDVPPPACPVELPRVSGR